MDLDNVIVAPHIAALTIECQDGDHRRQECQGRFGRRPEFVVNPVYNK